MKLITKASSMPKASLWAWTICGLAAVYYCYEYFLRITPSVILSELMTAYHLTGAQVGNLAAFYYYIYTIMQVLVGVLMDRYGPRRLLTIASLSCAVGTYMFAVGHDFTIAAIGRVLVGFGSSFAFVGALKLATIWLPPNRFAFVSGMVMCSGMIGAMAGDIMLRALVDSIGWQTTIYVSALVGVILAGVIWSVIRDKNPQNSHHFAHEITFKELSIGLLKAIRSPQIWLNGFVGFLLYLSLSAFAELWGIPYLQYGQGLSQDNAANANSMIFLGWVIGCPFWGWLSDHLQLRRFLVIISSVIAFAIICALLYLPSFSLSMLYFLLLAFGIFSSVQVLVFTICWELSSIRIAGTAIALTNMIIMISGVVFQPLLGKFLDIMWSGEMVDGARVYSAEAYQAAMSVLPVAILLGIIFTFFIRETQGGSHSEDL